MGRVGGRGRCLGLKSAMMKHGRGVEVINDPLDGLRARRG